MICRGMTISNASDGADGRTTRRVHGAQGHLGGHAPKSGTRSIIVSSMGGNDVGDVINGNVASKAGDVGDNDGMSCGEKVSRVGVEYAGGMKV